MASFTFTSDVFKPGETVTAYPASNWSAAQRPPTGAPVGSSAASATADATTGQVVFTGLSEATTYYAYASTPDRYVRFHVLDPAGSAANPTNVTGSLGSNASVGTTGSAAPTSATLVGGSDGTNVQAMKVSSTGVQAVDTAAGRTILFASISAATSGNNTIITATAAKKITVLGYVIVADGAVTATWQDGAGGTALSGAMSLAANGGVSAHMGGIPIMQGSTNTLLNLSLGGAVGVRGHISYYLA